jgi:dipeptidase E
MIERAFLGSKHVGGLSHVLPGDPADLRTVFVPTAGSVYEPAPWIDARRQWLVRNGFRFDELELATSTPRVTARVLSTADLVYVEGGNTYFLLHHMRRTLFWDALAGLDVVYGGASAGAIVACPDIGYIQDLDDRSLAPELADTTGAGIIDFRILPHFDDPRARPTIDRILADWPEQDALVKLNDDEAIIVTDGSWRVISSPAGDLVSDLPLVRNREIVNE